MPSTKVLVDNAKKRIDLARNFYIAELRTTMGPIRLRFLPKLAPNHVQNFLALVKIGYYQGHRFHYVVPGFVVQAGSPGGDGTGGPGYVLNEEFSEAPLPQGAVCMARGNLPGSHGSQFFICLEVSPHLDRQYSVFGRSADRESLRTAYEISTVPTNDDHRPHKDVRIQSCSMFAFESEWFTPNVRQLVAMIRVDPSCSAFPILGDALEEVGCTDLRILSHCRSGGSKEDDDWIINSLLVFDKGEPH